MGRVDACSPLPPPPTDEERARVESAAPNISAYPSESAPLLVSVPSKAIAAEGVISKNYASYLLMSLAQSAMDRFTHDWEGHFDDPYNQISLQFFLRTFRQSLPGAEYKVTLVAPVNDTLLSAVYYVHIVKTLIPQYKAQTKNTNILMVRKENARIRKAKLEVSFTMGRMKCIDKTLNSPCILSAAM